MGAGKAIGSVATGGGKLFGSILSLLFFKVRITITLIILLFYLIGAVNESLDKGNMYPLITKVGGRIMSADESLYWELNNLEDNDWRITNENVEIDEKDGWIKDFKSLMAKGALLFNILSTFWFIYMLWWLLFKMINKFNTSAVVFSAVFAIIFMILLQATYGASMLYLNSEEGLDEDMKFKELGLALTPLKGTYKLFQNIVNGNLLKETFGKVALPIIDVMVNETNSTVSSF